MPDFFLSSHFFFLKNVHYQVFSNFLDKYFWMFAIYKHTARLPAFLPGLTGLTKTDTFYSIPRTVPENLLRLLSCQFKVAGQRITIITAYWKKKLNFFFTLKALFLSVFFHSCRNQTRILPSNKISVLCSYPCCDWAVFILHLTFPHLLVMMLLFTLESQETFEDNKMFYLGVIAQYTCQIHFLRGEKRSAIKCGV